MDLPNHVPYTCDYIDPVIDKAVEVVGELENLDLDNMTISDISEVDLSDMICTLNEIPSCMEDLRQMNIELRENASYAKEEAEGADERASDAAREEMNTELNEYQDKIDDLEVQLSDINDLVDELEKDLTIERNKWILFGPASIKNPFASKITALTRTVT